MYCPPASATTARRYLAPGGGQVRCVPVLGYRLLCPWMAEKQVEVHLAHGEAWRLEPAKEPESLPESFWNTAHPRRHRRPPCSAVGGGSSTSAVQTQPCPSSCLWVPVPLSSGHPEWGHWLVQREGPGSCLPASTWSSEMETSDPKTTTNQNKGVFFFVKRKCANANTSLCFETTLLAALSVRLHVE